MPKKLVDAEEIANRILDTFGVDVRSDDQFDSLCDVVEDALSHDPVYVGRLCRRLGTAGLRDDVIVATLLTLLHQPFQAAKARVVARPAPAKEPKPAGGFTDMSMGAAPGPRPAIDVDDVELTPPGRVEPRARRGSRPRSR